MATTVGPIISKILQRVRDPQASTHSRSFVLTILGHAQQLINSLTALVIDNTSFNTLPGLLLYQSASSIPESVAIVDVEHEGCSLHRGSLEKLKAINETWPRSRSFGLEIYAPIGKDLFVLYPGLKFADTVKVYYVKDVSLFEDEETDTVDIAKDFEPMMEGMAEVILLLKQRDLDEAEKMIEMLTKRIAEVTR